MQEQTKQCRDCDGHGMRNPLGWIAYNDDPCATCSGTGRVPFLSTDDRIQLSRGFSAGDYANAYETTDLESALAHLDEETDDYTEAYRTAFVIGFFASYALHEIPSDARDTFDERYWSQYGRAVVAAGYCDDRSEEYQAESEGL